jgi:small subunit ribosomal protein S17
MIDELENQEAATAEPAETEATETNNEESVAVAAETDTPEAPTEKKRGRRTEKVGIVTSDKMTKTVVVRVDRLVKHPVYKRYVRQRNKFMAHNEIEGVAIGDQVRIVETRPLSAHKRWRVVEVLRKATT